MDLSGLQIKPLDRIAGVIDFGALTRGELSGGDARLPILRELAVELLPKIRVGRQVLGPFLPQELQWVTKTEIVDQRRPIHLQHP
jgi:hypothetical protein